MPDPIRILFDWPLMRGQRVFLPEATAQIIRQDPYHYSANLIARHELRVWFEPDWGSARRLARRFPRCLVFSVPYESAFSPHRVPGWRPRRDNGVV
jgi:hypothetical protein